MAPSAKVLSFLFLLSLLFTHQAQARDSQFFSKVTSTNTNTNNVKETELPKKENTLNNQEQEQEQPSFIPETQGGYGLYGHESGLLPPSTTTTTNNNNNNNVPYTAELEKEQQHTDNYPKRYQTQYNPNKDNFYYSGNNYQSNPSDTRLSQTSYTAAATTPTKYNQNSNYYNVERQGMSDTRFLENGKYYYDPNSENSYNQNFHQQYNQNQYENSRVVDSRNWYNNRGNYGNNYNNNNNNVNQNSYQNQEEFQENEDEFIP